jgi:hypothetical protein
MTNEEFLQKLEIYENELRKMRLEIAMYRSALTHPKKRKRVKRNYSKEVREQVAKMNLS